MGNPGFFTPKCMVFRSPWHVNCSRSEEKGRRSSHLQPADEAGWHPSFGPVILSKPLIVDKKPLYWTHRIMYRQGSLILT